MVNGVGPAPHPEHSAAQLRRTPQICFDMVAPTHSRRATVSVHTCVCLQGVCLHARMFYNGCGVKCVHRLCVSKCAESLTLLCRKKLAGHLPLLNQADVPGKTTGNVRIRRVKLTSYTYCAYYLTVTKKGGQLPFSD